MGMFKNYQVPLFFVSVLCILLATAMSSGTGTKSSGGVTLHVEDSQVVMDNGILQVTFLKPQGRIIGIKYNGIDNVLQYAPRASNLGGFWDVEGYRGSKTQAGMEVLDGTEFKAIVETDDQVEISFTRKWDPSHRNEFAYLNTDVRYIMLRGVSGFYSYTILEHEHGWPAFDIAELRIAFKLNGDRFRYMVITDHTQKEMPLYTDRDPPRAEVLQFKEAVLLVNPSAPKFKGQVDDKYQYSLDNKDNLVHGWISDNPSTGFWVITPSIEFKTGGPLKQDLTSHTGPISLNVFMGDHYVGKDIHFSLQDGEYWKKTLGPIFMYLNSNSNQTHSGNARDVLWQDAKAQMKKEVGNWPYDFPASKDFLKKNQRGTVTGRLTISDRYANTSTSADTPYVGLAAPGEPGSWQAECKGYQFWTRADAQGSFTINNVVPGNYSLYAWAPGYVGDFMHNVTMTISSGSKINLGVLTFRPPREGPTLWEIGVPDRSAAEFFIPSTTPKYVNDLFINVDKFRQYGLWQRYTDLYPKGDLVYDVATSDYKKDWFFAHVSRNVGNRYLPTTWQIKFNLKNIQPNSSYMLRVAVAAAHEARLEVRVNTPAGRALFKSSTFGDANAIARHGIHGFQYNYEVPIAGNLLLQGENTIYVTQSFGGYPFNTIMYDYLRLEGPIGA